MLRTAFILDGRMQLGETEIFVGQGYVITVRHGASASYARVRERAEAAPKQLAHGEDYVLYALIDFVVGNYLVVIERLAAGRRAGRGCAPPERAANIPLLSPRKAALCAIHGAVDNPCRKGSIRHPRPAAPARLIVAAAPHRAGP